MQRYLPFAVIWLFGLPFLIWLAVAPKVADERFWQVDAVSVKMGSGQVANPTDQTADAAKPADANNPKGPPAAPQSVADRPLSASAWPDDGVKIKVISPDLQEDGTHGAIPKISLDGTKPWQYYARPFPPENTQPRLAIVMRDLGLSDGNTTEAIQNLPGEISFAFSPYADGLDKKMQAARDRGHETLLQLPLEMQPGSNEDVGPRAYSSQQTPAVNQDNFNFMLSKMLGSIGVITDGGERFVNNETLLRPLMQNLSDRGLVLIDNTMQNETLTPLLAEQMKSPWARTLLQIDETLSPDAMDVAMGKAVEIAKQNGRALVVVGSSPLARSVIANWAHKLTHDGVVLAPLSSVVTLGSAAQPSATAAPAAVPTAPGTMAPPPTAAEPPPLPDNNSGPIDLLNQSGGNLLNPSAANGAPAPNILNPSAPPVPAAKN